MDMRSPWILVLLLTSTTAEYLVPTPPGRYNVTLTTGPLIDYARDDPYAAAPTPRALMLSVFQPSTCASTVSVPDMPSEVADYQGPFLKQTFNISVNLSPLLLEAHLPVCPDPLKVSRCSHPSDSPILLFSPGYSIPRLYYNVLASAIASEGFTVITIDHPGDANIIIYPDGHAVYNNASILDSPTWDTYTRAADASFVIDQLSNATAMAELLPQRGPRPFPTDRVAMLGHSAGGASAIIAASRDPRIRGAINWDGTIFGSPPPPGLSEPVEVMSQPVLFLSHQDYAGPSWLSTWPRLEGPKLLLYIENTTHYTFSDMPTLLEAAGQGTAPFADLLGTIAPTRMVRILTTYTTAWMNAVFTGKVGEPLLEGEEPGRFPEVSALMRGNF
ncbi:PAF acetylhydrolase [Chaetomium fimeti]|uniref:1-alkyl-2-acetylglycerophosphocholine esterase n=1 Tax=Chaetomium fimeti TaxID=1854472 RepID=A0AAE0HNL6_9PEZI|nr:PAF acetylhydrolase [Chaetomium fimeti]